MNGRQFGIPEPRPMAERPAPQVRTAAPVSSTRQVAEPENVSLKSVLGEANNPKDTYRKSHPKGSKSGVKRTMRIIGIAVIALLILVGAWLVVGKLFGGGSLAGINKSGYQAVYLTNGQAYFGKLQSGGAGYLKMSDIYYLQSQSTDATSTGASTDSKNTSPGTTNQNNLQLYKMTDATIVGPEDTMYISTKQILLYENLKPDSKVVQSIEKYQQAHQ